MKRLIKLSMCFLIMLGASGIQGVSAEGVTAYTGDAEQESELSEHELRISTREESSNGINIMTFEGGDLHIKTPVEIDVRNYKMQFSASNPDLFSRDSITNISFSYDYTGAGELCYVKSTYNKLTRLVPVKEGMSTINIKLINLTDESDYYSGEIKINVIDEHKDEILVIDKTTLNLKVGEIATFADREGGHMPEKETAFSIGLKKPDGIITKITDNLNMEVISSDSTVIESGSLHLISADSYSKELQDFANNYYSLNYPKRIYVTGREVGEMMIAYIHSSRACEFGGAGGPGYYFMGIVAKRAGTETITYRYGSQEVSIKVNVTDLTSDSIDKIPNDLANEFHNENNKTVNVFLKAADTVKADVFKAAKQTGKSMTFDIVGTNNKTQYAWTFNGTTISNPDMSLNLGINFTSDKESSIRKLVDQKDMMFLSFNHHGLLPGKASLKVDVSSMYKNGEYVYLNYYNEEKGIVEPQGGKILVKDGYVEFSIEHCSEYFLTKTSLINESNNSTNIESKDETIKNTGIEIFGNREMPLVYLALLVAGAEIILILKLKKIIKVR